MPFVRHKMTALIQVAPDAARKEILRAFVEARCHQGEASRILGCEQHTFINWVNRLGMRADLEVVTEAAKKEGWHHGWSELSKPRARKAATG